MTKEEKLRDPMPSDDATPEEIGEFWDTHSLADYWDETQEVDFNVNLKSQQNQTLSEEKKTEHKQLWVDLASQVSNLLEKLELTPAMAEEHYKLNPSDVVRIQNGDFDFNVGELLTILNQLNRDVEIRITPSDKKGGHIRVVAT